MSEATFELGDWVRFRDSTTGNIYLVIAVYDEEVVRLSSMPIETYVELLEIVQKNNRPKPL